MVDSRKRATASLKVKYKSATLAQFIQQFGLDISHAGIFIKTKAPLSAGTSIRLELQLSDGTPVILGTGRVHWRRKTSDEGQLASGMGIEFVRLDPESRSLVDRIVDGREGRPSRFEQTDGAEMTGQSVPGASIAPSIPPSQPSSAAPRTTPLPSLSPHSRSAPNALADSGPLAAPAPVVASARAAASAPPTPAAAPGPAAGSDLFVRSPWRSTATIETIDPIAESSAQSSFFSHGRGVSRPMKTTATSARTRAVDDKLIDDLFAGALPMVEEALASADEDPPSSINAGAALADNPVDRRVEHSDPRSDDAITSEFQEPNRFAEQSAITSQLTPSATRDSDRSSPVPSLRLESPSRPPPVLTSSRPSPIVIGIGIGLLALALIAALLLWYR